jgi:hypothetical protein
MDGVGSGGVVMNTLFKRRLLLPVILICAAIALGTAACSPSIEKGTQSVGMGPLLTMEDVVQELKAAGIPMLNQGNRSEEPILLDGVAPTEWILSNGERLSIYVYDAEVISRKAYRDFQDERMKRNLPVPFFYEVRNVLILYSHETPTESGNEQNTEYGSEIMQAGERMHGDEVVNAHGRITNIEKFREFTASVNDKKPDVVRIRTLTVEGDPIFYDVRFDGNQFLYKYDNSYDNYGGGQRIRTGKCSSLKKLEDDSYIRYELRGCSGEVKQIQILAEPHGDAIEETPEAMAKERALQAVPKCENNLETITKVIGNEQTSDGLTIKIQRDCEPAGGEGPQMRSTYTYRVTSDEVIPFRVN